MSKWKKVKLGDIGDFKSGGTPTRSNPEYFEGEIPWITTVSLGKTLINERDASVYISTEAVTNSATKIISKNSIMIGTRVGVGKVSINTVPMCTSQDIISIENVNEEHFYKPYILHCIKSYSQYFNTQKRGATIQGINSAVLKSIDIPSPPLETQKQIAKAIDTVTDLLALRKQQLAELDNLIKSTFYDMFGDPVVNEKGWESCSVGKTIQVIEAGWSADGVKRIKGNDEKAVLKVSAVTSGFFRETEYKVLDKGLNIKKYVFPHKNDLLFSRANTRELVGATCIIFDDYPDLLLPDKLWRIEFKSLANFIYMKYILSDSSIRSSLSNDSTGTSGSMYNISMGKFKSINVPLPPIELQNQFANIITKIEEQKTLVKKVIEETQYLFDSLMSEYFE